MIRRDDGESWLLITQVDHAHLAGDLAAAWGNAQTPPVPEPTLLLPAIRDHDEGWRSWEKSPRIHPDTGIPREFLEMPMTEAVAIWRRSIEVCHRRERSLADAFAIFEHFLATRSKRLTPDRTSIAEVALALSGSFDAERVAERMAHRGGRSYSLSTIYRTLGWLADAGLLMRDPKVRDRHVYRNAAHPAGPSPWPGLWVSRHFTHLAELARQHPNRSERDRTALDSFLSDQHALQAAWRDSGRLEGADEAGVQSSEERGYRWLQFFDRLSLWLCCAERNLTEQMARPDDSGIHFTPLKSGEIAVEPYPFNNTELTVSVSARRIAAKSFESDEALSAALAAAVPTQLQWSFVRW